MAISGTPSVDRDGQFNYTIPIAVPPGTAGMVPHLALTYSSENVDGYEGYGWTLGGLDKITRCPQTENVNGTHGGVNNDANDGFCYNGTPLLLTSNTTVYGPGPLPVYDTQAASFLKIVPHTTSGITGTSWWQVYLKNGTIIELGNTAHSKVLTTFSSSIVREWLVDKITDIHGNYLTVDYYTNAPTGEVYPKEIDYTGYSTTIAPYNSVQFVYSPTTRVDAVPTYQGGSLRTVTKLLSDIVTYNGSTAVLDYRLAYRAGTNLLHSRLTSLTLCDGTGSNCLAPMTFGWQGGTGLSAASNTSPSLTPVATGDFDGDGLLDIVVGGCPSGGAVYLGTSTTGTFNNAGMTATYNGYSGDACFNAFSQFSPVDMTGDGFTDIFGNGAGGANFIALHNMKADSSPSNAFNEPNHDPTNPSFANIGDFNGDGYADYLSISGTTATANLGQPSNVFLPGASTGVSSAITIGDFNGDGCSDVLSQGSPIFFFGYCQPGSLPGTLGGCSSGTIVTGDFNGDGITDAISIPTGGSATLCLSDGKKLTTGTPISSSSTWHSYLVVAGDFNGDGKADIALISPSGGSHMVALSTGSDFVTSSFSGSSAASVMVGDFNNDGADAVWTTSGSTNTLTTFAYQPEMMTSVSNGLGATVSASYDRINKNGAFYVKGTNGPTAADEALYAIDGAYYVVSQLAFSNGVGSAYTNYNLSYSYFNAIGFIEPSAFIGPKSNILSSRFQAFNQIISTDSRSGLITTKFYKTDAQLIGFFSSETVTTPGASPITLSETDSVYHNFFHPAAATAIYEIQRTTKGHDLDGALLPTHVLHNTTVDKWNNVQYSEEDVNGTAWRTINNNTPNNDTTNWILNQIPETDVTTQITGSTITRTTTFVHDPGTGFVTQMDVEPTTASLHLETDYHYDSFGNKDQTTQQSHDTPITVPSRTNYVTYDPAHGEFPLTNTDPMGHVSQATFSPYFGLVTSVIDPNGVSKSTDYDSLGRVHDTYASDDPHTVTYSYNYCAGVNGGSATCPTTGAYVVTATPTITTGQDGVVTSTYYDAFDRVIATDTQGLNGSAIRTSSVYDSNGLLSQTSRPYFRFGGVPQWTTYAHDALFRTTQVTYPDSSQTSYCYHGLTTAVTNALGQTKTTVLDIYGNVLSVTDGQTGTVTSSCTAMGNSTTTYLYDAVGDVVRITDANGNYIANTYDNLGRKVVSADPDMGTWNYTYDPLGELIGQVDAKSQSTTIAYDKLQRPILRTETVGGTSTYSKWLWDTALNGIGELANACTTPSSSTCSGGNSQQTPTYDSESRIAAGGLTLDGSTYTYTPTYDPATGRVASLSYPSGFRADYTYNTYGYLTDITDHASGAVLWHASQADAEMHLTQQTAGNNVVTTSVYDPQTGRVQSICADTSSGTCLGGVANFSYGWDAIGNLSWRADTYDGWTEQFCYDKENRLMNSSFGATCTTAGTYSKSLSYDMLGNMKKKSDVCNTSGCMTYGVMSGSTLTLPHALTSITGTVGGILNPAFVYDANGNMTCEYSGTSCAGSSIVRAITYTPFNMASTVADGGITMGLDYRADRMRYKMCVPNCGSAMSTTFYLYDPATGGMSEKAVTGAVTTWTDYVLSPEGHIVATRTKTSSSTSWLYTVVDNLGSAVSMTDTHSPTPNVTERDSYDAWGKRRDAATGNDLPCGSVTSATTRGYTGHEMIDGQCLINMNARLYDPTLARFQSADSIVPDPTDTQSYNRYSYGENNPLNRIDPTGHMSCWYEGELPCENTDPEVGDEQGSSDNTDDASNGRTYDDYHPCYSCSTSGIPSNILAKSLPGSIVVNRGGKIVRVPLKEARKPDQEKGMWGDAFEGTTERSVLDPAFNSLEGTPGEYVGRPDGVDTVVRMADRQQDPDWYETLNHIVGFGGVLASIAEHGAGTTAIGTNLRLYPVRRGNKYFRSFSIAKAGEKFGAGALVLSVALDVGSLLNQDISQAHFWTNMGMDAVGLLGGYGAGASATYYWFESGAADLYGQQILDNQAVNPNYLPMDPGKISFRPKRGSGALRDNRQIEKRDDLIDNRSPSRDLEKI